MDLARGALAVGLLRTGCESAPRREPSWRSVEFSIGPQGLDESSWAPLDARIVGALTMGGRKPDWPCGMELGFQYARAESKDDSVASGADFIDFRVGAAWEWRAADWLELVCGAGPRIGVVRATRPGTFAEVTESD